MLIGVTQLSVEPSHCSSPNIQAPLFIGGPGKIDGVAPLVAFSPYAISTTIQNTLNVQSSN